MSLKIENSRRVAKSRLVCVDLKHVGRQRGADGQNKFLQINDSKGNLSYIIIRMNLILYIRS
jgi:hypothetical protein